MKKKIVVYKAIPDDVLAYVRTHLETIVVDPHDHDALLSALHDADGALGSSIPFTPAMLDAAPRLTALSTISVGYDQFDVADLTRRGIVLTHTPDVLTESTADTVFALILATARRVVDNALWVKRGEWKASVDSSRYGVEVSGKTLGIVGLGRIGGAVARRAALGFNMKVLYTSRTVKTQAERDYGAARVPLTTLLAESDFVCLQVPLTEATRGMIGAEQLAIMKPSAILINGGRGAAVDEPALIDALRAGTILGAGLDVFQKEPVSPDSPLLDMDNVVALPHIGSATHETRAAMARNAAENIVGTLAGTLTENIVNPEALGKR